MGQYCACFAGVRRAAFAQPAVQNEVAPSSAVADRELVINSAANQRQVPAQLQSEETSSQDDEAGQLQTLPSVGSAGHATGDCKRCAFFPKDRCQNGYACNFCHFDHEKGRRTGKKKRGSQGSAALSAPPTPSVLGSTPLSAGSGYAYPSPSHVAQLAPAEMPQHPVVATPVDTAAGATSVAAPSGTQPVPPMPMSWTGATPLATTREPVTIEDLLLTSSGDASARPVGGDAATSAMAQESEHMWQHQYWPADAWAHYDYYQHQEYHASMASADMLAPYASTDPQSSACPADHAAYAFSQKEMQTMPSLMLQQQMPTANPAAAGFGNDSPRSVLLTMCGAWGALAGKTEKKPASPSQEATVEDAPLDVPPVSREKLLRYRSLYTEPAPADAVQSVRVSAKRGGKNGPKRGRAT